MEERQTVKLKKEEFAVRERIKLMLGKGKVSKVKIEYTPIGEKIIISTHKPGLVIGRKGERIEEMSRMLRTRFKLSNPQIEINEIKEPEFDAQINADEIALALERFGPLRFKVIAYRTLQRIIKAGALGVEIRLNGKLPGARARPWRFAQGYLKKTGDEAKVVSRAQAKAQTKPGTVGVKVAILSPHAVLKDKIVVDDKLIEELKKNTEEKKVDAVVKKVKKKTTKKKVVKTKSAEEKNKEISLQQIGERPRRERNRDADRAGGRKEISAETKVEKKENSEIKSSEEGE